MDEELDAEAEDVEEILLLLLDALVEALPDEVKDRSGVKAPMITGEAVCPDSSNFK